MLPLKKIKNPTAYLKELQDQKKGLDTAKGFTKQEIADLHALYDMMIAMVNAMIAMEQSKTNTIPVINPITVR